MHRWAHKQRCIKEGLAQADRLHAFCFLIVSSAGVGAEDWWRLRADGGEPSGLSLYTKQACARLLMVGETRRKSGVSPQKLWLDWASIQSSGNISPRFQDQRYVPRDFSTGMLHCKKTIALQECLPATQSAVTGPLQSAGDPCLAFST